jgi:hypothetical protein
MVGNEVVSPRQAAQMLGTTLTFIYSELWSGRFPGARMIAKHWEIPAQSVRKRAEGRASRGQSSF